MGAVQFDVVKFALDAAMLQQQVAAQNIANANVANYQAVKVDFADVMASLQRVSDNPVLLQQQLSNAQALLSSAVVDDSQLNLNDAVQLDQQVALSLQSSGYYKNLIAGLNGQLSIYQTAIRGGR